jgi:hypothetical protein
MAEAVAECPCGEEYAGKGKAVHVENPQQLRPTRLESRKQRWNRHVEDGVVDVQEDRRQAQDAEHDPPAAACWSVFQSAVHPPSTVRLRPVTYAEASEARKTIGPLMSAGPAILRSGVRAS